MLRMRFGIDEHRHTLEEVGKRFDVANVSTVQIEAALRNCATSRSEVLRSFLDD